MRKPQPSLTKGQVIAQKMAEANLIVDHQSAKTPVAALIDSELQTASGSAANTDAVHSKSPEQTGDIPFKQLYGFATAALDKIYNHNEACRHAVIEHYGLHHYPYNENFKDWIASQAPTDSAVQQEDRYTIIDTPDGEVLREPPENPIAASPQTSEAAKDAALNWFSKPRTYRVRDEAVSKLSDIIQSAIDAKDAKICELIEETKITEPEGDVISRVESLCSWAKLRKSERDAAARVEPTKTKDLGER